MIYQQVSALLLCTKVDLFSAQILLRLTIVRTSLEKLFPTRLLLEYGQTDQEKTVLI